MVRVPIPVKKPVGNAYTAHTGRDSLLVHPRRRRMDVYHPLLAHESLVRRQTEINKITATANACGGFYFKRASSFFNASSVSTQSTLWGERSASASSSHAQRMGPTISSINSQYARECWGFQKMWWY